MSDYYTGKILNILTRQGASHRSVVAFEMGLGVFDKLFTEAVDKLKTAGKITEIWRPASGGILSITKAPETAQDAPEEAETGIGSTTEAECGTGQDKDIPDATTFCGLASDDPTVQYVHMPEKKPLTPEESEKLNKAIDLGLDARNAVSILSEAYWSAIGELSELRKENEQLRKQLEMRMEAYAVCYQMGEEMRKLRETNSRLLTDNLAYHAIKEKLRGIAQ